MEQRQSYVNGLGCKVVQLAQIQTRCRFRPAALEAEIRRRAQGNDRYVKVAQAEGANCYNLLIAYPDSIDNILAIVEHIERDVANAKEQTRLLALCVAEE